MEAFQYSLAFPFWASLHTPHHIHHTTYTTLHTPHHTYHISYTTLQHTCPTQCGFCFWEAVCPTTFSMLLASNVLLVLCFWPLPDTHPCRPATGHSVPLSLAHSLIFGVDVSLTSCDISNYNFLLRQVLTVWCSPNALCSQGCSQTHHSLTSECWL